MPADSGRISEEKLESLLISQEIEKLNFDDFLAAFKAGPKQSRPDSYGQFSVDPRSEEAIIYNPARAKRPHDYDDKNTEKKVRLDTCPICAGETTGVLDLVQISDGYTFINRNLFPALRPPDLSGDGSVDNFLWGFHLLQWTSSAHEQDWHNMPVEDCVIVMSRLGAVESKLLRVGGEISERLKSLKDQAEDDFYISIIKNTGSAVGGSLEHGHQQILLSSKPPRRLLDNQRFEKRFGMTFSDHLQAFNPPELLLRDYGEAVLVVSKYMRRPLEMVLAPKDTKKSYLHQLDDSELRAVSRGWMDATGVLHNLMPQYGREIAFNVVTHNGPGSGLYFEFLPYTQEQGGFEQLGLSVCQAEPFTTAIKIRGFLEGDQREYP